MQHFWGTLCKDTTLLQDRWLGVRAKKDFEGKVANISNNIEGQQHITARELVQAYAEPKPDRQRLPNVGM